MTIKIEYSKSTGKHTHVADNGVRTEITALPPQTNLKAVIARAMAMGLKIKKDRP